MNTYLKDQNYWDKEYEQTLVDGKWTRLEECPQVYVRYQKQCLLNKNRKTVKLMAAFMSCKIGNHKWCKGEHFYKRAEKLL